MSAKSFAAAFVGLTAALVVWRVLPPTARRPMSNAAGGIFVRLRAELKPVFLGVEDRFKAPAPDPTAGQSAAGLAAPTGGPVRRRPAADAETPTGRKAPMLSEKGVSAEQEVRGSLDGPVLRIEGEKDQTRVMANKLIVVTGSLAAIFMLVAWFRGDPNAKTLT